MSQAFRKSSCEHDTEIASRQHVLAEGKHAMSDIGGLMSYGLWSVSPPQSALTSVSLEA